MRDDTRKFFEKLAGAAAEIREEEEEKDKEEEGVSVRIDGDTEEEKKEFEPELVRAKASSVAEKVEVKSVSEEVETDLFDEGDGQLAIDVFQTDNDIIVEAPVAGVGMDNLDIEITPESVTIRGKRDKVNKVEKRDYLYQECYWGRFSRSVILPQEVNADDATATFKNGILRIVLPKVNKKKSKKVKVRFE